MLEKVRTKRKAWARVVDLTKTSLGDKQAVEMAILHVNAEQDAQEFESLLREELACPDKILLASFTAGLSVHTGRGMIGVVVVAAE